MRLTKYDSFEITRLMGRFHSCRTLYLHFWHFCPIWLVLLFPHQIASTIRKHSTQCLLYYRDPVQMCWNGLKDDICQFSVQKSTTRFTLTVLCLGFIIYAIGHIESKKLYHVLTCSFAGFHVSLETGFHVAQAGLEFLILLLLFWITGIFHHAWLPVAKRIRA